MEYPEVKHLHKYYAYNENSLSVLINKKICVSKPGSLNDPFDSDINFNFNTDDQLLKKKFEQGNTKYISFDEFKQAVIETKKELKEWFRNSGVFSMCKNDDNILVWSHYADQHRGFCIKFDRESNNVLGKTERTKPIEYKDDYPDVDLFDPTGKINESIFKDMFFIKTKGWEYEWEWRFVCDEGDKEEPMPFNISSIIFGLKMPQRHRDTIINILSGQGISFKEAVKADNQFKINIIDLPE